MRTAKQKRPKKPYDDFPLSAAANGQWQKKIKGKVKYFGVWENPEAALQKYLDQRDDLQAGRVPRAKTVSSEADETFNDLGNSFLAAKEKLRDNGELSARTYAEYQDVCVRVAAAFGRDRLLTDIRIEDFEALRVKLSIGVNGKRISAVRLGNLIRRVRTVFKFANETDMIERPIKFGPGFKGPSKKVLRTARRKRKPRMLESAELRRLIDSAKPAMKAMILLGINCGFGNSDIANLKLTDIDLKKRWIEFPRPKTGIERRCPLWPETVAAIKEAIAVRTDPKPDEPQDLVFVTKYGRQFVRTSSTGGVIDSVYAEFKKLLNHLKMTRDNLGFYAIRHTHSTIGDGALDPIAVSALMGHVPHTSDMGAVYRERIDDGRLIAVTDYIRAWLWPKPKKKATKRTPVKKTTKGGSTK